MNGKDERIANDRGAEPGPPPKFKKDRFRFGTDSGDLQVIYRPHEILVRRDSASGLQPALQTLGLDKATPPPEIRNIGEQWAVIPLDQPESVTTSPIEAARLLRRNGVTVHLNHVYFLNSLQGRVSFNPNMFTPNMFTPNMFTPNMFTPNMFGGAGGAHGGCCSPCPTAPMGDEERFIPEHNARKAWGPIPGPDRREGHTGVKMQIHILDARPTVSAQVRQDAKTAMNSLSDAISASYSPNAVEIDDDLKEKLRTTPGALLPTAYEVEQCLASSRPETDTREAFERHRREPESAGLGADSDTDRYVDPVTNHAAFIAGIIHQIIVDPAENAEGTDAQRIVHTHAVAGPLGDVSDADLVLALRALQETYAPGADELRVLNLSLGGFTEDDKPSEILAEAIKDLRADGWLIVAAAGNEASCRLTWPAALPGVVSVAAYGPCGPAWFSNYGPWVDACAPGVNVISNFPNLDPSLSGHKVSDDLNADHFDTGWASWSGTSFSAPFVAAKLAAWMMDKDNHKPGRSREDTYDAALDAIIRNPGLARIPNYGTFIDAND